MHPYQQPEVRCSSHPTSSKKHRKLRFSVLFHCKNAENSTSQNAGQLLTHTVTHTQKCAERVKEYRIMYNNLRKLKKA